MNAIESVKTKVKAPRAGSRLQNRACDQCRRAKRRCDLAEAGLDGDPIHDGPCKLCIRKHLQCTSHWADLQQTVSSSRDDFRQRSQVSPGYGALSRRLSSRDYRPAGLSPTTKALTDAIDSMYITAKQLSIYITAWEWTWLHLLGPDSAPLGVGIDVVTLPRFGLLSSATNRVWEDLTPLERAPHIPPNFFFSVFACDEAYRHCSRIKRPPPMADQLSNQALQYAILAYASQFGSQSVSTAHSVTGKSQKEKDLDIAEAAWVRARDFIMKHSTVHTFRMAYALHLFSSTCPPLRSARAESNPTLDSVSVLQTGLKMLDELATELRSQQLEDLYAMGYFGADGTGMMDDMLLSADPDYRNRVSRSKALIGVAENLLWYSAVADAAAATSFGLPLVVRGSSGDTVDLDAVNTTDASWKPPSASDYLSLYGSEYSPLPTPPLPNYHDRQNGVGGNSNMPLHPVTFASIAAFPTLNRAPSTTQFSNDRPYVRSEHTDLWGGDTNLAVDSQFVGVQGPWNLSSGVDSIPSPWVRIVQRAQRARTKIPTVMSRLRAAPREPVNVKAYLAALQTAAAAQVMIWQRTANFRHGLNDHSVPPKSLAELFARALKMILFVQANFQMLLDIDARLYFELPASAQTMVVMLINNASTSTLHFLELCSTLEGQQWLHGSDDKLWPRASVVLREPLQNSTRLRADLRRTCAIRITQARKLVQKQVSTTLESPSVSRESSSCLQTPISGTGTSRRPYYKSEGSNTPSDWTYDGASSASEAFSSPADLHIGAQSLEIHVPRTEMVVSPLQIHISRHPVPTMLADSLHLSFRALIPDALEEISQNGAVSARTLDSLDSALTGLQEILSSVLSFGPFYFREPTIETLFSTRNWLAPHQPPMVMIFN